MKIENLWKFWGLFLYAALLCLLTRGFSYKSQTDVFEIQIKVFLWNTFNSILSGILNEIGFRFLYICTSMINLVICDYVIKVGLFVIGAVLLFCTVYKLWTAIVIPFPSLSLINVLKVAAFGFFAYLCFYIGYHYRILYAWNEYVVLPVTSLITLGYFDDIFYADEYPKLMVFGMIAANGVFRDSQKYDGRIGWANAWIIGFVMIAATLRYGLLFAIVLHVLYDLEFAIITLLMSFLKVQCRNQKQDPILPIIMH